MSRRRRASKGQDVPVASLAHACTGRARLCFSEKRGERQFFEALCDETVKLPGVKQVEARPLTGSLIVSHEGSTEELILAARFACVFDAHDAPPAPEPSIEFESWKKWLDHALHEVGGPAASANSLAAFAFFLVALRQVARGQTLPPATTALYYGISILLASHGKGSSWPGPSGPQSGN